MGYIDNNSTFVDLFYNIQKINGILHIQHINF